MRECKKVEKDKKITLVEVVKNDMLIKEVIEYDSKKKNRMMEKNTNGWPRLIYWGSVVDPSIWDKGFLLVVTHYYQTIGGASVGLEKEIIEHENHWR